MTVLLLFFCHAATCHAATLPRTLIALYDSREESTPRSTLTHRYAEMPLNHLGYKVEYHDINSPLPPLDEDTAGAIVWFNPGTEVPDAKTYLAWLEQLTASKRKLVVFENFGLGNQWRQDAALMADATRILARIGVRDTNRWQSLTYDAELKSLNPAMTGFERPYETTLPAYMDTRAVGEGTSHLQALRGAGDGRTVSDLIVTSPQGGYVAASYGIYQLVEDKQIKLHQWYINPFLFLRLSLQSDALPKPDFTTENGVPLFYAVIDADGWNDFSESPAHRKEQGINATVMRKEVLEKFPNLPFTVSATPSELDARCYGLPQSEETARAIFALENVEAASHTHSHPLFWNFFADYSGEKEKPYLSHYPERPRARSSLMYGLFGKYFERWDEGVRESHALPKPGRYDVGIAEAMAKFYKTPRSFACAPFSLAGEIKGAAERLQLLLPPDKKLSLLTWPGDTRPFAEAVEMAEGAGLQNFGGGDARFDPEHPSYSSLPPLGVQVGKAFQVYNANGNETGPVSTKQGAFAGDAAFTRASAFQSLPLRVKPLSLYAHMHDARGETTLKGLQKTLEGLSARPLAAITPLDFTAIVKGFYGAKVTQLAENSWRIEKRGALQSMRFDRASLKSVDFARSKGVTGQRYLQGDLYVALDSTEETPVITLKPLDTPGIYPKETEPYIIFSNWRINSLKIHNKSLTFNARGFGKMDMQMRMPTGGDYRVTATAAGSTPVVTTVKAPASGLLHLSLGALSQGREVGLSIEGLTE